MQSVADLEGTASLIDATLKGRIDLVDMVLPARGAGAGKRNAVGAAADVRNEGGGGI